MFGKQKIVALAGLFSAFDPDQFSAMSVEGQNDTKYVPVPEGEYAAVITKKVFRPTDKGQLILDVTWKIDDATVAEAVGMKEPTVRQSVFIDRLENGSLDMGKGKNVKLGQLREAVGLNKPGQVFNFNMLEGRAALIKVKHRQYEGDTFADVKDVTAL